MKVGRFLTDSGPRLGMVVDDGLADLTTIAYERGHAFLAPVLASLKLFLLGGPAFHEWVAGLVEGSSTRPLPLHDVTLLAPFEGGKILAAGTNYPGHAAEVQVARPSQPFLFSKVTSAVTNPGDPVLTFTPELDYEVELAAIIGRPARDITAGEALSYVGGYTILNDISYRDRQLHRGADDLRDTFGQNWVQGKGLDGACPMGPWVLIEDGLVGSAPMHVQCRVNGDLRQDGQTTDMTYSVAELVAFASRSLTLLPGDVISTGTPAGVAFTTGNYLRAGDVVECEITEIGVLRNPVADQRAAPLASP